MKKKLKKIIALGLVLTCCLNLLTACGSKKPKLIEPKHIHQFSEQECEAAGVCECGETIPPLGHDFVDGYCTRCGEKDPDAFSPEEYGFDNQFGMYNLIGIEAYNLVDGTADYFYTGHCEPGYTFKDNLYFDCYNEWEDIPDFDHSHSVHEYTIISNDTIRVNGDILTITDRVTDADDHLILKAKWENREVWFILADQVDLSQTEKIVENKMKEKDTYYQYTRRYHFK